MPYQYNYNKRYYYFGESQERRNIVRKHYRHNRANGNDLNIMSY